MDDGDTEPSSSAPKRSKLAQCNEVIETINKGSKPIMEFDARGDTGRQAQEIDALEKRIGEMKIDDPELKKNVDVYRKMVSDFAKLARDLGDPSKLEGMAKRTDELSKTENEVVDKINRYCGG